MNKLTSYDDKVGSAHEADPRHADKMVADVGVQDSRCVLARCAKARGRNGGAVEAWEN